MLKWFMLKWFMLKWFMLKWFMLKWFMLKWFMLKWFMLKWYTGKRSPFQFKNNQRFLQRFAWCLVLLRLSFFNYLYGINVNKRKFFYLISIS